VSFQCTITGRDRHILSPASGRNWKRDGRIQSERATSARQRRQTPDDLPVDEMTSKRWMMVRASAVQTFPPWAVNSAHNTLRAPALQRRRRRPTPRPSEPAVCQRLEGGAFGVSLLQIVDVLTPARMMSSASLAPQHTAPRWWFSRRVAVGLHNAHCARAHFCRPLRDLCGHVLQIFRDVHAGRVGSKNARSLFCFVCWKIYAFKVIVIIIMTVCYQTTRIH